MTAKTSRAWLACGTTPYLVLALAGVAPAGLATAQTSPSPIATPDVPVGQKPSTAGARAGVTGAWSSANATAFDQILADRAKHGLDHVVFLAPPAEGDATSDRDAARTAAALAYAGALAQGRVDPASLHAVYTLPRPKADLTVGLARALAKSDLAGWFDSLAPQDAEYRQLSEAYLTFNAKASVAAPALAVPSGLIRVGDRDARVSTIVEQLVESGYLLAPAESLPVATSRTAAAPLFTQAISDGLKGLQTDYGIAADGVVGPATLKVLNLGPGDRARALAVGLERRRWLARTPAATRIDVNTAAAELRYYRDGTLVDTRKVIVGEAGRETPPLSSPIYRLVANPTWTIPKSIQQGEMAGVSEAYLQDHNMVMRDGWIVQQPGPNNALGLVKFDMANDQAIYLHDTSAPALFDRSQRQLSHGCVRVEDAQGFAQMIAEDEGVGDAWSTATASGEMTFVPLPKRIPVRLLYHNVYVADDGRVAFRTDPYGWNDPIAERLGFARASANQAEARAIDIGP